MKQDVFSQRYGGENLNLFHLHHYITFSIKFFSTEVIADKRHHGTKKKVIWASVQVLMLLQYEGLFSF